MIADSRDGIAYCINVALAEVGADPLAPETVNRYIGPPLINGFRDMLLNAGVDPARASDCVDTYRRHYGTESLTRTTAFPGITDAVERLSRAASLVVVTSKLEVFARPLLAALQVDQWLPDVFSPPPASDDEPKAATLARAIAKTNLRAGTVVMIADLSHDVVAAIANHAVPIGVLWGFGSKEELAAAGATLMAETPRDLVPMVQQVLAQVRV